MNEHQTRRLFSEMIDIGTVSDVRADPLRYKVRLTAERETDWIRQTVSRAGKLRSWNPYSLGEQVLMVRPIGGHWFILGSLNKSEFPQPASNLDLFYQEFADGTWLRYDQGNKKLEAFVNGEAQLKTAGDLKLHAGGNLYLRADQEVFIDGAAIRALEDGGE